MLTFFFGAGLAFFIALLAWGDDIRRPQNQIQEIEKEFRISFKLKKKEIKSLARDSSKVGFLDKMSTLIALGKSGKLKVDELPLLNEMENLNKHKRELETIYNQRYFSVIVLTVFCLISGALSYFNGSESFLGLGLSYNIFYLILLVIGVFLTITNLVVGYFKETSFLKELYDFGDKIEG